MSHSESDVYKRQVSSYGVELRKQNIPVRQTLEIYRSAVCYLTEICLLYTSSLGIGDVTQPLAPAIIEALHKSVDEMEMCIRDRGERNPA